MMFEALRKYATFEGRARRSEYWLFVLFVFLVEGGAVVLGAALGGDSAEPGAGEGALLLLLSAFVLAMFVPSLAVAVRRLHDTNRSGWWVLIGLIPIIGAIVMLVFMVLDGTVGPNRFGDDPKNRGAAPADAVSAAA